ncbi:MAG: hypothetical protein J6J01_09410, partial [Oscillospiraceae bacterium]|nr:hypothetical protein [Oscillospiraceae bacterium]
MILFHAKRDGTVTTTPELVPHGSSMQDLAVVSEFDYAYCAIRLNPASGMYIDDIPCTPILQSNGRTLWTASLPPEATVVAGPCEYQLVFTAADGTTQTTLEGSFTVPRGVLVSTPTSVGELSAKTLAELYAVLSNIYILYVSHESDINKSIEDVAILKQLTADAAITTIPPAAWEQADEKDPYTAVFGKAGDNEHITLWAADGASYDWLNTNRPTVSITGDKLMLTAGEKPETELSLVMLTEPFQAEDTEEETVYSYAELAGLQDEAERLDLGKRMTDAEGKIVKLAQTTAVTRSITIHPDEWTAGSPSIASFTVEGLGAGVTVLLIPADIATQTAAREARLSAYPAVFTTVGGQMVEIVRANEETAIEIPLNFKVVLLRSASESEPTVAMIGVDAYGETAQGGGSGGDTVVVEQSGRMLTIPADSWAETKSLGLSTWITGAIPLDGITPQTMVRLSALD